MSATVYISCQDGTFMSRTVPNGNHADITRDGHLLLTTGPYGQHAGLFKQWDHVVINQRYLKGPDGRFVSKEKE